MSRSETLPDPAERLMIAMLALRLIAEEEGLLDGELPGTTSNPSFMPERVTVQLVRDKYYATRRLLNLCELTGAGVAKGSGVDPAYALGVVSRLRMPREENENHPLAQTVLREMYLGLRGIEDLLLRVIEAQARLVSALGGVHYYPAEEVPRGKSR